MNPGTYTENINFLGKDIIVASKTLTTGNKSYVASTIIDGSSDDESVVTFENNETLAAMLLGFTIQNGRGSRHATSSGVPLYGNTKNGGGIFLHKSSPRLKHLLVKNNKSTIDYGGGIFFGDNSDASLEYSTIYDLTVF